MSKSASMSTDTLKVKGKKQKSQILQAMVEALYRFNPRALFGSPILFTLWLAAVMATLESLLGQPLSGVAPSLAWQLTAWLWLTTTESCASTTSFAVRSSKSWFRGRPST